MGCCTSTTKSIPSLERYKDVIGPYWDKERRLIDEEYKTIAFPFKEIAPLASSFSFQWSFEELHGYLTTWSAVQKFMKENSLNPVDHLMEKIKPHWLSKAMRIEFPLFMRIGTV